MIMFSNRKSGLLQRPIVQRPPLQLIRIHRNTSFVEQDFIAHDISHPIEFTRIHSVHIFFVHPRAL